MKILKKDRKKEEKLQQLKWQSKSMKKLKGLKQFVIGAVIGAGILTALAFNM